MTGASSPLGRCAYMIELESARRPALTDCLSSLGLLKKMWDDAYRLNEGAIAASSVDERPLIDVRI